jgi:hypothetical protein
VGELHSHWGSTEEREERECVERRMQCEEVKGRELIR